MIAKTCYRNLDIRKRISSGVQHILQCSFFYFPPEIKAYLDKGSFAQPLVRRGAENRLESR